MKNDDRLDDQTRDGLRILAASTGTTHQKAARRLARAAESGQRTDYLEAEAMFNALPAEGRRAIGSSATERARSERAVKQQQDAGAVPADAPGADGMTWRLGNIPGNPTVPTMARKSGGRSGKAGGKAPAAGSIEWSLGRMPGNPSAPSKPRGKGDEADDDPSEGSVWDWRRPPEDPVLEAQRRRRAPRNAFEELRREMLGPLDD